jgi:Bifunctional DNA primase/polymerase, N-terminal
VSRRTPQEDQAHRFADAGWPVFPAAPGSKIPITEHGYLDATTGHRQIQQWFRAEPQANLAVATGKPGPDVVDVDKKGEHSGYAAWNDLKRAGLAGEPQAIVRTPSGGMHAYYRGTEHQRNGHLPDKLLDFRSTGGYVVTPPSTVGGRPYAVVSKQASAATFDWSKAREHLDPQPQRQPYRAPERDADRSRDVSHLADWVARQPEGNRNEGLFWAANRAVEAGDTETLTALSRAAQAAGLSSREADRTIRSAQQGSARPFEHSAPNRERASATVPGPRQAQARQAEDQEMEAGR